MLHVLWHSKPNQHEGKKYAITLYINDSNPHFCVFFYLEKRAPRVNYKKPEHFNLWWCAIVVVTLFWIRLFFTFWPELSGIGMRISDDPIIEGFSFYLFYSFSNYWFHRVKHSNPICWMLHKLHHSTSHMESKLAFYRHPLEVIANGAYLIILGRLVFDISIYGVAIALLIEGSLEVFHHSNIKIGKRFEWIGHIVQTPDMHLIHHEFNLHRYNYSPFLWDTIFRTARIPKQDKCTRLGFKNSNNIIKFMLLK